MSLQENDLLQGRYHIVRSLKQGGMGAVYEARDTKLADSPCAVKEILEAARSGRNSDYIQSRFFQEMKALSSLDHPSIPKVRDYLTVDSTIYIVMDLIQGASLDEEIEKAMARGHSPEPESCVRDVVALLDTVAYLHSQRPPIIHRDIKPANILRDPLTGSIKLVDFGLARALDTTSNQTLVGTLGYCSPEQMMGKASQESDLYSVGITLHHLLTGKAPETINFEPLKLDLPGVRPGLEQVVEKATQINPADRYASASDMAHDLRAWLEGLPSAPSRRALTPATGSFERKGPTLRPGWTSWVVAAVALCTALALGRTLGHNYPGVDEPRAAVSPVAPIHNEAKKVAAKAAEPEPKTIVKVVYLPQPVQTPTSRPRPADPAPPAPIVPSLGKAPVYPTYSGPPLDLNPQPRFSPSADPLNDPRGAASVGGPVRDWNIQPVAQNQPRLNKSKIRSEILRQRWRSSRKNRRNNSF